MRVCRSIEVGERHGHHVEVDIETDLALFRVDGEVFVTSNVCPHKREPFIYDGVVVDGTITCPIHAWTFNIRTGSNIGVGGGLACYPVREEKGYVWVDVAATE